MYISIAWFPGQGELSLQKRYKMFSQVPYKHVLLVKSLLGGLKRQWTHENLSKDEAQQNGIEILTKQLEKAALEKKEIIIMGNANLCSAKWKEPNFVHKKIANQLIGCLDHCELIQKDVGITFQADHIQSNGLTSESELDHVFILINYYYYYFNHFE